MLPQGRNKVLGRINNRKGRIRPEGLEFATCALRDEPALPTTNQVVKFAPQVCSLCENSVCPLGLKHGPEVLSI